MGSKSYTGHGDGGQTGLGSGERARKSAAVFEALGALDELNTVIGLLIAGTKREDEQLRAIQSDLLDAGAMVCAYRRAEAAGPDFARKLRRLEGWTDEIDAHLPPLSHFILPGGCPLAAHLHHCRVFCRRAERRVEALEDAQARAVLPYLNRLSSYFFARARWENIQAGVQEHPWNAEE